MSTAKHTPGPWHVSTTHIGEIAVADSRGINLCVLGDASLFDTITPDAAIIAAAPVMYEALQNLLEWAKGNRGVKEGNPYCKPEVRQALKVLASIQGKKDYLDADTAPQAEGR